MARPRRGFSTGLAVALDMIMWLLLGRRGREGHGTGTARVRVTGRKDQVVWVGDRWDPPRWRAGAH